MQRTCREVGHEDFSTRASTADGHNEHILRSTPESHVGNYARFATYIAVTDTLSSGHLSSFAEVSPLLLSVRRRRGVSTCSTRMALCLTDAFSV